MVYTAHVPSPLGRLMLASDGEHLTGLWLEGQKYFAAALPAEATEKPELPLFRAARNWLDLYFGGGRPAIAELPLAPPRSSDFRRTVWELLTEIPYGTVATYGEIARETAARLKRKSMSAQAVGGAVGHNPISIVIPCHRVVGTDGSLTGYAGGIEQKIRLLKLEGVDLHGSNQP